MAKKINIEIFNDKTKNSDRELFDVDGYRLIDGEVERSAGNPELVQSYFLFDDRENGIYEITLKEAYDLLALYADKDVEEGVLCEDIEERIGDVEI
jgi:hypothetical protein